MAATMIAAGRISGRELVRFEREITVPCPNQGCAWRGGKVRARLVLDRGADCYEVTDVANTCSRGCALDRNDAFVALEDAERAADRLTDTLRARRARS